MSDDRRLIEDLVPVEVISEASAREKQGARRGHISSLHQWWARRPLAAARAAVYATLVRAGDVPQELSSAEFFRELCRWGASEDAVSKARSQVIASNGGHSPQVLDMFAGGGAIPLEAARLGCEATAVELNPVAHLVELCLLDYPQRFASLADDVRERGAHWVERTWDRVGDLYPAIDSAPPGQEQLGLAGGSSVQRGRTPVAYLWTRTVACPNTQRGKHRIPLVRQSWLARKKGRYIALRPRADEDQLAVHWDVVQATEVDDLGFDPAGLSARGRATCFICGTSVDSKYVKEQGVRGEIDIEPLAAVLRHPSGQGREYVAAGSYEVPAEDDCLAVLGALDVKPPSEPLPKITRMTGGMCTLYGLVRYEQLFMPRQLATLCSLAQGIKEEYEVMLDAGMESDHARAVCAELALVLDRTTDFCSSLCPWVPGGEFTGHTYARQALPMVWDFSETNPFGGATGDLLENIERAALVITHAAEVGGPSAVKRASATEVPAEDGTYDAVITDPPYYDNISYADLSEYFYVWLKRSVGFLFPEHLEGDATPKRREIVAVKYRHDGDQAAATRFYEDQMADAFREAHRVLKPDAPLVCVYAHKTTLGWAALVEALRRAGFTITEAWPLDTEMPQRSIGQGKASLASSIFLVARRRETAGVGQHTDAVRNLDEIVAERLSRLSQAGVAGSDLIIAAIGAGLRAFTSYERVELPNGEEVLAASFLEEVQSRVLNAVLADVHGLADGVGAIDAATRYYVISRFSFGYVPIEFDEANNLARSAGVELDKLGTGAAPLAELKKDKVRLLDYSERGEDPELGLSGNGADRAPLIDVLHGLLWRAGHRREEMRDYLAAAHADGAKLRIVAQALQGPALRGDGESKPDEAQACERVLGAWKTLVDDNLMSQ